MKINSQSVVLTPPFYKKRLTAGPGSDYGSQPSWMTEQPYYRMRRYPKISFEAKNNIRFQIRCQIVHWIGCRICQIIENYHNTGRKVPSLEG